MQLPYYMRKLCLLALLLWVFATVRCQIPSNEIAPEDAAFNGAYANRSVPKVTGKLLNLQPGDKEIQDKIDASLASR
jgi:hypothetical protein